MDPDSLFLSEHVKRYSGLSPEAADIFAKKVRDTFVVGMVIEDFGARYLADFANEICKLYKAVRVENAKLRTQVKNLKESNIDIHQPQHSTLLEEDFASMSGMMLPNVEKINLKNLVSKPKYFNGIKPNPSEWIREYKDAVDDNRWSEQTAIYYFKHFLQEDAKSWYNLQVKPKISDDWSWSNLYELFEANYLGRAEQDRLRAELNSLKMEKADRVANFIYKIKSYLVSLDPNMNEYEQVQRISGKLRPEYITSIVERDPKTIEELRDICRRVEAARDLRKIITGENHEKAPSSNSVNKFQNKTSTAKDKPACHRCGRFNHLVKKCIAKTKVDGTPLDDKKSMINLIEEKQEKESEVSVKINAIIATASSEQFDWLALPLICEGISCNAVIDSGAQKSIMNHDVVQKNNWKINPTNVHLSGPNNSSLEVLGCLMLTTKICIGSISKEKRHRWIIVKNLAIPILSGADLISDFDLTPDLKRKRVSFFQKPGFRVLKDTKVFKRSEQIIATTVNQSGTLATVPFNSNINLVVANCIVQTTGEANILVGNFTDEHITVCQGTVLAGYEILDLEEDSIINNVTINMKNSSEILKIGSDLSTTKIEELRNLNYKYQEAFSLKGELGCVKNFEHDIILHENAQPIMQPARRHPRVHVEEVEKQVSDMLEKGIIEPSKSPWSSAYVVVKKKTGDFRVCIDFRRLNLLTKKDAFPLPNIETCLESIAGNNYYSSFDLAAGYWQMPLSQKAKELTAFRTETGHYQFIRMPFGLCNAPASFERMMNSCLSGLRGLAIQVYLDDVCLASKTWQEHLDILEQFFVLIIKSNLKIKPSKCTLAAKSVIFLGHEISADGIKQDRSKIKALEQLPRPNNLNELRRVVGLLSYYRRFVPNFATLADPLTKLMRKTTSFCWGSEQEDAMNKLIQALKQNAILAHFNNIDRVALKTDASKIGIAGILLQKQNEMWKIVSCYSRKLNNCEQNYGVTDMEGLAVVESIKKFRPYLLGRQFDLIVDHCALCILQRELSTSPRLRRWSLLLQEYDFKVVYQKGALHSDVDCLSRAPLNDDNDFTPDEKILTLFTPVDPHEWVNDYNDEESSELFAKAVEEKDQFKLVEDLIYFNDKLYIPSSKRITILKEAHCSLRAGHRGIAATSVKLRDLWWPTINVDVNDYVKSCVECQARKVERAKPYGAIQHFEAYEPFQTVCIDTFGPISESLDGNRYIIVAVDSFSKFIEAAPVPDLKAPGCASFLLNFFSTFGTPSTVRTDNGPQFLNDLVNDTLKVFGVEHSWSTADHSQGNAIAARAIQTLQEALSLNCSNQLEMDNWDTILPVTVLALNTTISKSTGYTPFEMIFGRKYNILDNHLSRTVSPRDMHTKLLKYKLDTIYGCAIENQSHAKEGSANYFNKNHQFVEFKVGDLVMIRSPNRRRGKMEAKFLGPFKVLSRNNAIYTIEEIATKKVLQRHIESIKPYKNQTLETNDENSNLNAASSSTINFVTKPSKLTSLFSLILLLAVVSPVMTTVWTREPSVMWQWADKTVYGQNSYYDVLMALKNPCESLASESNRYEQTHIETKLITGSNISHPNIHTAMVERCEKILETVWETEVKQLLLNCQGRLDKPEQYSDGNYKRSLTTDITVGAVAGSYFGPLGAVGGVSAVLLSDLVGVVWDHISPFSDTHRLSDVEAQVGELIAKRSHELNAFKNITSNTVRLLNNTLKIVERNEENVDQLMLDLPEYIFGATGIMDFIQHNTRLLRRIRTTCSSHVEVMALAELIQLPSLNPINMQDSEWISITATANRAIRFVFKVVEPSFNSHVVKVTPFEVWDVTQQPTALIRYEGPEYLIYNRTAACAKQITLPATHIVMDRCDSINFYSHTLKKWTTIRTSKNVTQEPQVTEVKYAGTATWVYCFPGEITIGFQRLRCPTYVFSLPIETSFNTSDYPYKAPRQFKNRKTNSLDLRLGAHFAHLPINDEHEIMQQLEGLRDVVSTIDDGPLEQLPSLAQWAVVFGYLPFICVIIGLLLLMIAWHKQIKKAATDVMTELRPRNNNVMVTPSLSMDDDDSPFPNVTSSPRGC